MSQNKSLPLLVTFTIVSVSILIAMSGVAFLSYALYRGLIAAFALTAWAAALATGGGAFVSAGLFMIGVSAFSRWRGRLRHTAARYKNPETYAERLETEIDARLDPNVTHAIFSNPKGAVMIGLALGAAAGASRDIRRLLIQLGRDLDLTR